MAARKRRQTVDDHGPDDWVGDLVIFVPQHIADPANLLPGNVRSKRKQIIRYGQLRR